MPQLLLLLLPSFIHHHSHSHLRQQNFLPFIVPLFWTSYPLLWLVTVAQHYYSLNPTRTVRYVSVLRLLPINPVSCCQADADCVSNLSWMISINFLAEILIQVQVASLGIIALSSHTSTHQGTLHRRHADQVLRPCNGPCHHLCHLIGNDPRNNSMGCWGFQERPVYPQPPSHNRDWNEKLTRGIDCTDPKTCIYHLDIWTGKSPQHCTITDKGDPATTHPWFGKSCTEVCHFLSTFLSI